jgi:uncharacterized Zn-binding protein involved in type VI secretion
MSKPAARLTDMHVCPMSDGPKPHVGGPITAPGCPTVLIGGLPAARVGDMATCVGPPDSIVVGAFTVLFGNQPAARMGDQCAHGGTIVMGLPTVLIGESGSGGGASGSPAAGKQSASSAALASTAAVAAAFESAAGKAMPLVCRGPCAACGQV